MVNDIDLKITQIIQRTSNVKSVRLAVQDPVYRAGQFCCVSLKQEPVCKRYLSISSSPTEKGYLEFTKRITQSDFSSALNALKEGDSLKIQYPFGKFTLDDAQAKIVFLSGGIGITPIRSICKYVVDTNLGTDMILVYANSSINEIVFRQDLDQMQKVYPKLKVAHVLYEPEPGFKCTAGLINAQVIKDEVPDFAERKFYVCGPPPMVVAMEKILSQELNIAKENIITEQFQGY